MLFQLVIAPRSVTYTHDMCLGESGEGERYKDATGAPPLRRPGRAEATMLYPIVWAFQGVANTGNGVLNAFVCMGNTKTALSSIMELGGKQSYGKRRANTKNHMEIIEHTYQAPRDARFGGNSCSHPPRARKYFGGGVKSATLVTIYAREKERGDDKLRRIQVSCPFRRLAPRKMPQIHMVTAGKTTCYIV